tara:strand:+ start:48 stop:698 length:651 start_codon:yes stop_codon:yes gene_type:complete
MGQNSTEVSYGFGQMGSVFTNLAKPVFPPKDHVIVAVQFLDDNTPTSMITETLDTFGPQFPSTDDTEASANNYLGVTEAAANGAGTTAGVVTLTSSNSLIKPGQFIVIGADGDEIDAGIDLDTSAGHITPIYRGPNQQGLVVKTIDGTSLTIMNKNGGVFDASNLDASNTLYFLDEHHGVGGTTTEGVTFPKGITIYGRWTTITPSAAPIICYFGK